jgi:type IV secretory pathway TraG/TraD family ATPase VirD4
MSATKILWGQILVVSASVLATTWATMQCTALRLGYQSQIGDHWFVIFGAPFYPPPAFFWWWFSFDAYAPRIFFEGAMIAASGGFTAIIGAIALSVRRAREAKNIMTDGSARWATGTEIRAVGLLKPDGVVLGRFGRGYLRHDGPEHVLRFAPTRSGKGVGLVVPTLLTWPGSAIVHDIKGENWTLAAGWRSRFGRVLLFDPTNPESSAYNPLLEVRRGNGEVRDVQNVADILVDPEGALERQNHWERTSHSLLVGAILHVLYAEPDKTLAGVANFLSDPKRPVETTLRAMITTRLLGDRPHPVAASAARELLNKNENERSGVLSTAMSFLGLYRDPVIAKVLGDNRVGIGEAADHLPARKDLARHVHFEAAAQDLAGHDAQQWVERVCRGDVLLGEVEPGDRGGEPLVEQPGLHASLPLLGGLRRQALDRGPGVEQSIRNPEILDLAAIERHFRDWPPQEPYAGVDRASESRRADGTHKEIRSDPGDKARTIADD